MSNSKFYYASAVVTLCAAVLIEVACKAITGSWLHMPEIYALIAVEIGFAIYHKLDEREG